MGSGKSDIAKGSSNQLGGRSDFEQPGMFWPQFGILTWNVVYLGQRCYQDQGVRDQDQTKTRQAETETETKTREAETKTKTKTSKSGLNRSRDQDQVSRYVRNVVV